MIEGVSPTANAITAFLSAGAGGIGGEGGEIGHGGPGGQRGVEQMPYCRGNGEPGPTGQMGAPPGTRGGEGSKGLNGNFYIVRLPADGASAIMPPS